VNSLSQEINEASALVTMLDNTLKSGKMLLLSPSKYVPEGLYLKVAEEDKTNIQKVIDAAKARIKELAAGL